MTDVIPAVLRRHRQRALELLNPVHQVQWMWVWVDDGFQRNASKEAREDQERLTAIAKELALSEQREKQIVGIERDEYKHLEEARRLLYNEMTCRRSLVPLPVHEVWLKQEEELRKLT